MTAIFSLLKMTFYHINAANVIGPLLTIDVFTSGLELQKIKAKTVPKEITIRLPRNLSDPIEENSEIESDQSTLSYKLEGIVSFKPPCMETRSSGQEQDKISLLPLSRSMHHYACFYSIGYHATKRWTMDGN